MDFKTHLRRQIGFLERSSQSYDAGNLDEAIRIATVIRVLVHSTRSSRSLLEHLDATSIDLLSTAAYIPPNAVMGFTLGMMRVGGGGSQYFPGLDQSPTRQFVPVSEWWNQVVFVLDPNTKLGRKDIVLTAANKDGGAHVDNALTKEYEALASDGALGEFIYVFHGETTTELISNAHCVAIRQMAYELLNSPQLIGLAIHG